MSLPVLMITYNRLDFTKQALAALLACKGDLEIFIIDNDSSDGTQQWLGYQNFPSGTTVLFNKENKGIAGAMNQFFHFTKRATYIAKIDNDTVVPEDFFVRMLPHMAHADIVQAKHHILKATHPQGFDAWVSTMKPKGALRYNHFVGGSGIMVRRGVVDEIPETEWMLGGWRQWQREHPDCLKAFATDVEIELLDTGEEGADYSQFPEYYIKTQRL